MTSANGRRGVFYCHFPKDQLTRTITYREQGFCRSLESSREAPVHYGSKIKQGLDVEAKGPHYPLPQGGIA